MIDSENEAEGDDNVEKSPSGDSASQRFVDELNVLGEKSWNKSMGRYELDQKILQKEKEIDEL